MGGQASNAGEAAGGIREAARMLGCGPLHPFGLVTVRWPNAPAVIAEARPRPVPAIPGWCTAEADPVRAHALEGRAERRGAYLSMASGVALLLLAGVQHLQHS
jgi:hypothetical protein